MKSIIVHYSIPTQGGYSPQQKIHEGEDIRATYDGGLFIVRDLDRGVQYFYSLVTMTLAEVFEVPDDLA